jgi:hypothetical protein
VITDDIARKFGIRLPADFVGYRNRGGGGLPPWLFLSDEDAVSMRDYVNEQYTRHRDCLPFARNISSDDIVLFTPEGKVRPVHLFASEGWESVMEYESFRAWLREALEDCLHQLERMAAGKWYEPKKSS